MNLPSHLTAAIDTSRRRTDELAANLALDNDAWVELLGANEHVDKTVNQLGDTRLRPTWATAAAGAHRQRLEDLQLALLNGAEPPSAATRARACATHRIATNAWTMWPLDCGANQHWLLFHRMYAALANTCTTLRAAETYADLFTGDSIETRFAYTRSDVADRWPELDAARRAIILGRSELTSAEIADRVDRDADGPVASHLHRWRPAAAAALAERARYAGMHGPGIHVAVSAWDTSNTRAAALSWVTDEQPDRERAAAALWDDLDGDTPLVTFREIVSHVCATIHDSSAHPNQLGTVTA